MDTQNIQLTELISTLSNDHGVIKTTSREIARHFDKQHKNVIRDIRDLDIPDEFAKPNFQLCHEISELQNGKPLPYYLIAWELT